MLDKKVICVIALDFDVEHFVYSTLVPRFRKYIFETSRDPIFAQGAGIVLVLIEDLVLGNKKGSSYVSWLREHCPNAKIVGFSASSYAEEFTKAGADGFIDRSLPTNEIVQKIRDYLK